MVRAFAAVVSFAVGCGRIGFDASSDGATNDGESDGALPAVVLWAAEIGMAPDPTSVRDVVEDAAGDLWLVGDSFGLGPHYQDGWIAKLDGATGDLVLGGIRNFETARDTTIHRVLLRGNALEVVGAHYDADSQQPTLGRIGTDGAWIEGRRMAGGLVHPGEFEGAYDIVATQDGGAVIVGRTRVGMGSCTTCTGTDALAIKVAADRSIVWARAIGQSFGDEWLERIVTLPGGDIIAFGGAGVGQYDYSGGAGTDVDSAPALIVRLGSTDGALQWARRPATTGGVRGSWIVDGFYDTTNDFVVVAGQISFQTIPILATVKADGAFGNIRQVRLNGDRGVVTAVLPADDGGLFFAGYESTATLRNAYVARTTPTRDGIVWARQFVLESGATPVRLVRSRRGDLVIAASGGGADGARAVVARIDENGNSPQCAAFAPATIVLVSGTDASVTVQAMATTINAGTTEAEVTESVSLDPMMATRCSP